MNTKPDILEAPGRSARILVWIFVVVPFAAFLAAFPITFYWGYPPTRLDVLLMVAFYTATCTGVGVGYHRFFTHGAFKAQRSLKIALGILGSMAIEGAVISWVADHRRHHKYSDKDGDPHSPWRFGTKPYQIWLGLWHAHVGWLLARKDVTNPVRFAPDLLRDKDVIRLSRLFPWLVVLSFLLPASIGGLMTWSWQGALSAFFWAGLVRVCALHHVTWSVNSICHVYGERPFKTRDKASNVWWLALLSFGESWHNLHHADPKCARHGVLRGQIDINARIIWVFERLGWAHNVKWPDPERVSSLQAP